MVIRPRRSWALVRHALYLAQRSLRSTPLRSAVLVFGVAVAFALPLFTRAAAVMLEDQLLRRARATPIVLGAKGNEFDLTLGALYFRGQVADPIPYRWRGEVERRGYGVAVPLDLRSSAMGVPVVGTGLEYFEMRDLRLRAGRLPALLGEVVAGAAVARRLELQPGESVRSDLTNLYNLAGAYPLVLDVVGVLEPTGGADDDAFFADVRTTWSLDGRIHGHDELEAAEVLSASPGSGGEGENLEATAALFLFQRISEQNRRSFHMHGDVDQAPLSALLVFPADQRAHDQLLGDFALEDRYQAVRPETVVRTVLGIVLRASELLDAYFVVVALATCAFFALVVWLSLRLRASEITLMAKLGASRGATALLVGAEVGAVVIGAFAVALGLTTAGVALLTRWLA
jgi:putative ABC transport system permease protein